MIQLVVAPCSHDAAKFAVMNWHYSRQMPVGKLVTFGAWEHSKFIGAVIYGRGASPALGAAFGLDQTEVCELVRVALTKHEAPVTQIVARSLKLLRQTNCGLRLVISFADPHEGHHGGIYQAGGWVYNGDSPSAVEHLYKGKWHHSRNLRPTGWGTLPEVARLSDAEKRALPTRRKPGKHRYLYPLDKAMRRRIAPLALPYPRGSSLNGEMPTSPVGGSGSIPESRSTAKQ